MAILSEAHGILFVINPRTGCTAIGNQIINQMGGRYIPSEDFLDENGKIKVQKKHTTVIEIIE